MKSLIKTGLFVSVIAAVFSSCDPGYSFTEEIVNNSSVAIDFYFSHSPDSLLTDTFHVDAGKRLEILNEGGLGTATGIVCGQSFTLATYYKVQATNGKTLLKNVTDPDNWTNTSDKGLASSEKHCFFEIKDGDLE